MTLRQRAFALYRPPFRAAREYIMDANGNLAADGAGVDLRVRGWGRIGYLRNPEMLQDEVEGLLAESGAAESGISPGQVASRLTKFWEAYAQQTRQVVCSSEPVPGSPARGTP